MSAVHGLFAALGVELPDDPSREAPVRCFADPDAHAHGDRRPSASVNTDTGAWCCHSCGARGGPYDAAVALGRSPAGAMELLERHGLVQGRGDDARKRPAPGPRKERPKLATPQAALDHYAAALVAHAGAVDRLATLRGWSRRAIEMLALGLDGDRIVFPVRDQVGALVGVLRYQPDPERREGPKMKAEPGSSRGLFPAPEAITALTVALVEGEPDAVTAWSIGLPAVAIPGANGWRSEWRARFAGRHVVLIADADAPGAALMRTAAGDLCGTAASVRVLNLAEIADGREGYDLTDALLEARDCHDGDLDAAAGELRRLLGRSAEYAPAVVGKVAA